MFFNTGFILFSHPYKNLNINNNFYLHATRNYFIYFSFYIDEVKIASQKCNEQYSTKVTFSIGSDIKVSIH